MKVNVLLIGLNKTFISSLERADTDYQVFLLEEEKLFKNNPYHNKILKEVRYGDYQQSEGFMEQAIRWHKEVGFDVVVPGSDYAVRSAYKFAEKIGLLTPGERAVKACTNKYELRKECKNLGIPHPNFSKVKNIHDVKAFFKGSKIVVKPANRRASVGVIGIETIEDIESAWKECIEADENVFIADRDFNWEYIVEDYIDGYEVSIETIVAEGKPIFHNITYKETTKGKYFVEIGHTVPAPISQEDSNMLIAAKEQLLSGLEVKAGLFHSEWKMSSEGPKLIECAARTPGDYIPVLIEQAYGFNINDAFLKVLQQKMVSPPPTRNQYITAIRYFNPKPGRLIKIEGLEIFDILPQITNYEINLKVGQNIHQMTNSWSRLGYYSIKCKTLNELNQIINQVEEHVKFIVE